MLAAERERQGLSRADVAQRLHWSPLQVDAMETGDYERLPKGTFLRGFVRNYARLLGLDPEVALAHLDHDAPREPLPGIVVPTQNIRFDPIGAPTSPFLKAGGLVLLLATLALAAIYWWIFIRTVPPAADVAPATARPAEVLPGKPEGSPQAPETAPSPESPSGEMSGAPHEPAIAGVQVSASAPSGTSASRVAENPQVPGAPRAQGLERPPEPGSPSPVLAAGHKALRFSFRSESWVEVRDGAGQVLLQRLNPPGTTAEVSGRPPFGIVIGNAPDVTLTVDGREFALAPHTKVAVARFTLE
jgi:cytoskeleton protein RodZ